MTNEYHTVRLCAQASNHASSLDRRGPLRANRRMETWQKRLRNRRKLAGMNQSQLGELVGVEQSTVAMWESGRRYPEGEDAFDRLATALGCTAAWLRYGVADDPLVTKLHSQLATLSDTDRLLVQSLLESLTRRQA